MSEKSVLFVDRHGALAIWGLMIPVAQRLEQSGWRAGFIAMGDESGLRIPEVPCALGTFDVPVPRKRWAGDLLRQQWAFERAFSAVLRKARPDVVHVNFAIPGIWARRVARRSGVPFVVSTQHELAGSLAPHLRLGLRATARCVDVHTYVSEAVARSFGRPPEAAGSHLVIRNGVDEQALRAVAPEPGGAVPGRIVAPGRLMPEKGQALLIEALAALRAAHPRAHLILAGSGPDEPRLRDLAGRLGVAEAVQFAGWLPRQALWRLLTGARAAAFPSDGREGFGLALAEAALLGVPVVASRIAAFREVLAEDEAAAYWFEPKRADDLTRQLDAALADPDAGRAERAERARHNARARASLSAMLDGYARLYQALAQAGSPRQAANG